MANNPLQQYFRQPKVFVSLPSQGVYNEPGVISGDPANLPVFGMTGMDEIILKTPDALLTGDSTVRVIQSCCPGITNAWAVSNLDVDALLVAIRIATYGNVMGITHICTNCATDNNYDIDVSKFLDHFAQCKFNHEVVIDDLTIRIRPLNYKQVTEFNLENFALQKRLFQISELADSEEKTQQIAEIYSDLGVLQNKVMIAGVEQVEVPGNVVTEYAYIKEWIENSDSRIFDAVRKQVQANNTTWQLPSTEIKCDNCGTENSITINLDQSSFFASA
jgi:hypothetical protein